MTSKTRDIRREVLGRGRRLVVKIGSRLIAESPAGRPAQVADQVAQLRAEGAEVTVVSSGAISLGLPALGPGFSRSDLPSLQAAAAVGQGRLVQYWQQAFAPHGIAIAQVLITHSDVTDRTRFLNARHALRVLLEAGVCPIVNENDTVAVEEIKYGDNDLIAAVLCNLLSADALLILTDVDGLLDSTGQRVDIVHDIAAEAEPLAGPSRADGIGSGGMMSKVQAAKVAATSGAATWIGPGREPDVIVRAWRGESVGTLFVPVQGRLPSRKHWIAFAGKPAGEIHVDTGAWHAVRDNGGSLLPVGVTQVEGDFALGELIVLLDPEKNEFARGLAGYSANDIRKIAGLRTTDIEATLGYKYLDAVIHRDDLVLL